MAVIAKLLKDSCGFIQNEQELTEVVAENRLHPCLVRCNMGRFTCPAQDVDHFVDIIQKSDNDYVRDISVLRKFNKWE
jgi:hypothetical protein